MFGLRRGKRRRWSGDNALMRVPGDSPLRHPYLGRRLRGALVARLSSLFALAALLLLGYHLLYGGAFAVQRVEVVGTRLVDADLVRSAAHLEGVSMFEVNRAAVRASVLTIRPIRSVDVGFVWPNTVRLTVAERRPAYIWKVEPTLYLVSEDGVVLAPTTEETMPVTLVDVERQPVAIGEVVDARALAAARYLRNALASAVGVTPSYFEYSRSLGVVLPTDRGYRVAFGFGEDLPSKVITYRAVAEKLAQLQTPVQLVDLRFSDRPYFR